MAISPTVSYPNPEDKKAFALALDLAKKVDADLVLATIQMQTVLVYMQRILRPANTRYLQEYVWHVNLRVRDVTEEGTWHSAG